MGKRFKFTILILFAAATLFLPACSGSGGGGASISYTSDGGGASDAVTLEKISVSGDEITLALKFIGIGEAFKGAGVDLTYDSSVTSVKSVDQGDLLSGSVAFVSTDDGSGNLLISNVDADLSANRSGTLVVITLKRAGVGEGDLAILSSSAIFNGSGAPIPGITWSGGTVVAN